MADPLLPPFLPAVLRSPPALPAFPLRPLPRLAPAFLTAVARHRMCRSKSFPTSFQQTLPASRLPRSPPRLLPFASGLLSLRSCRILTGAHGRAHSRKAQVSEGMLLLSEAPSRYCLPAGLKIHCEEHFINSAGLATFSPPSTLGSLAHSGPPKWPILSPPPTPRGKPSAATRERSVRAPDECILGPERSNLEPTRCFRRHSASTLAKRREAIRPAVPNSLKNRFSSLACRLP